MKKYLKMSDVFEGGVIAKHIDDECLQEISFGESCGNCWSIEDDRYWIAVTKEHAEYAAHSINSHDELVEMNKELLALAERLVQWDIDYPVNCDNGYAGLKALDEIIRDNRAAISKAKGGAS